MCARKGGQQRAGSSDDDGGGGGDGDGDGDGSGGGDGGGGNDGSGGGGGVLVKKPVITRLDSELADRKIRLSPFEDNTRDTKGWKGRGWWRRWTSQRRFLPSYRLIKRFTLDLARILVPPSLLLSLLPSLFSHFFSFSAVLSLFLFSILLLLPLYLSFLSILLFYALQ